MTEELPHMLFRIEGLKTDTTLHLWTIPRSDNGQLSDEVLWQQSQCVHGPLRDRAAHKDHLQKPRGHLRFLHHTISSSVIHAYQLVANMHLARRVHAIPLVHQPVTKYFLDPRVQGAIHYHQAKHVPTALEEIYVYHLMLRID